MNPLTPMSELYQEHQNLLAAAPRLSQLAQEMESRPEASTFRAEFERFREALLSHFRREEALFASVKQAVVKNDFATDLLATFLTGEAESDLQAHGALTNQTAKMLVLLQESAAAGMEPEARNRLRELLDTSFKLLRSHADNEDKIIFPIIVHVLRREQKAMVREQSPPGKEKPISLHS
jgi:iron-sulfur cluster repair protein YtfE (RIC family)